MKSLISTLRKLVARLSVLARVRLPTDPIPEAWPQLIAGHVPLLARLPPADQDRLYHMIQLFLKEVPFEGCRGLELSEEIRVTIAAQACLLLLRMPYPRFDRVRRVLVYPAAFVPRTLHSYRSSQLVPPDEPAGGQAWQSGVVILGWDEVQGGAFAADDGRNVVIHEFAHMLDVEDGTFDGTPVLDSGSAYRTWATLWSAQFDEHVRRVAVGEATVLDSYGATNRSEFFAAAAEAFFETPLKLRQDQPALYGLLVEFFKLDPASLFTQPDARGWTCVAAPNSWRSSRAVRPKKGSRMAPLGLEPGVVRLVEYDARWPTLFTAEAQRIRGECGTLPLSVEHIGGTAIPGMCAKPVLDIVAGRLRGTPVQEYIVVLQHAGYDHRGEQGVPGREFFRRGRPRAYHVHLVEQGGPLWCDYLAFRDYLRAHAEAADQFADLKRALAARFPRDREAYIAAKSARVREILELAKQ